jgi:uncharacterized protein (DUF488 family)
MTLWTIGHSTRPIEDFLALLRREDIERLVDVRAFPGSRRHPQYNRESLCETLADAGIDYLHRPALGGRRRPPKDAPSSAWRNEGFRGYAAYMPTPEFHAAIDELLARAAERRTVIMCSEAVPWRCHRTLISDALTARGVDVEHILDASTSPHALTSFAVVRDGEVTYPAPSDYGEHGSQHALELGDS